MLRTANIIGSGPNGLAAAITLSACAQTHTVYVTNRTTGAGGQTTVTSTPGHPSGEMSLQLNGKTYSGRWLYMAGGGSVALSTVTATSGAHVANATGTALAIPTQGNGTIILSAPDGDSLRCVFDYSQWSKSGVGVCQDKAGGLYDVQID